MKQNYNRRIAFLAVSVFVLDQLTKFSVMNFLPVPYESHVNVVPGFFRLVHWHNTGAAFSLFHGNNLALAIISTVALIVLILARDKFGANTTMGSLALGLIFGGIVGNLCDRVIHHHVIDFLYFHLTTRSGVLHDFAAFNLADTAICVGVGLLFILSWRNDKEAKEARA